MSSNYPPGAENDSRAPYNQHELDPQTIDVEVTLTLTKVVTVEVTDYIGDEDDPDFSYTDFEQAVKDQVYMPHELSDVIKKSGVPLPSREAKVAVRDCADWKVQELNVEKYEIY